MKKRYIFTSYNKRRQRLKIKCALSVVALIFVVSLSVKKVFFQEYSEVQADLQYNVVMKPLTESEIIVNSEISIKKYEVKTVGKGDSYGKILGLMKFENNDIFRSASSLKKVYRPENLRQGDKLHVYYTEVTDKTGNVVSRSLDKLRVEVENFENEFEVVANLEGEYVAGQISQELVMKPKLVSASIENSLYQDALSAGIPPSVIADFTNIYSFDLDFQRDIMKNDNFKIFFEAYYDNTGKLVKSGRVIYSEYKSQKLRKDIKNYRYQTTKGSTVYLDPEGKSIKKSLLLTPINGARISSSYGMRFHPVLGYSKMHKGMDFAAPKGTPIYAAGNGQIVRIGWNGAYGKYIQIRHDKTYSTAYAHMTGFRKGLKNKSYVKQGDIIGYVGSTGRSTGPHLHYEVLKYNKQINPRSVKSKSEIKLYGKELTNFAKYKERVDFIMYNAYASLMN